MSDIILHEENLFCARVFAFSLEPILMSCFSESLMAVITETEKKKVGMSALVQGV